MYYAFSCVAVYAEVKKEAAFMTVIVTITVESSCNGSSHLAYLGFACSVALF